MLEFLFADVMKNIENRSEIQIRVRYVIKNERKRSKEGRMTKAESNPNRTSSHSAAKMGRPTFTHEVIYLHIRWLHQAVTQTLST